ncbi:hypothetical protein LCGC14_0303270 [marine sediment metagenome]|uniref:Uncharacterized protein n=1 Tax=marine sediment metagenome TaxID=412755 RepID=A0A0F9WBA7_9ZZZZ
MTNDLVKKEIGVEELNDVFFMHNQQYRDERTSADWFYFYKKFRPDLSVFGIIKDGDLIVATQGMMPYFMNVEGKKILAAKSENTLTDAAYRGRNLFKQVYDFCLDVSEKKEIQFIWGLTKYGELWERKVGFEYFGGINKISTGLIKIKEVDLNYFNIYKNASRMKKLILKPLLYLYLTKLKIKGMMKRNKVFADRIIDNNKFEIVENLKNDTDLLKAYENYRLKEEIIHIHQNSKYLDWRLYSNPKLDYKTLFLYEKDVLLAYAYYSFQPQTKIVNLADFTFFTQQSGIVLLQELFEKLIKEKISFIKFFGNIKNELVKTTFDLLSSVGFDIKSSGLDLVVKPLGNYHSEYLNMPSKWHITGLWFEGYEV